MNKRKLKARAAREELGTAEVSRLTGATMRQLQWWDERGYIRPRQREHKRFYSPEQTEAVRRIVLLRNRGVKVRRALVLGKNLAIPIDPLIAAMDLLRKYKICEPPKQPRADLIHARKITAEPHFKPPYDWDRTGTKEDRD